MGGLVPTVYLYITSNVQLTVLSKDINVVYLVTMPQHPFGPILDESDCKRSS